MRRAGLFALGLAISGLAVMPGQAAEPGPLKFKMKSIDGKPVDFKKYNGRVMLVVNLASQ
tara:strand:- start:554 stop:733 length:180 start_codon:yes stop_codon:yes gene_type:complete